MQTNVHTTVAAIGLAVVLSGCGSVDDSGLTSSSGLGSDQRLPAVFVEPGNVARYEQALAVCRQVAVNRHVTASQVAQLESLTGERLDARALFARVGEGAGIGAAAGALGGLVSASASGTESTADEARGILLNCLRITSKNGTLWQVME